jgi:hypothetical protein
MEDNIEMRHKEIGCENGTAHNRNDTEQNPSLTRAFQKKLTILFIFVLTITLVENTEKSKK